MNKLSIDIINNILTYLLPHQKYGYRKFKKEILKYKKKCYSCFYNKLCYSCFYTNLSFGRINISKLSIYEKNLRKKQILNNLIDLNFSYYYSEEEHNILTNLLELIN